MGDIYLSINLCIGKVDYINERYGFYIIIVAAVFFEYTVIGDTSVVEFGHNN